MEVWRSGATKELSVTVGEIPADTVAGREGKRAKPVQAAANRLGLVLSELSGEQRKALGIANGVAVEDVRGQSRADIRKGDIILALVNKGVTTEAKSVAQFNRALDAIDKATTITLQVRRGDNQSFIAIDGLTDQ